MGSILMMAVRSESSDFGLALLMIAFVATIGFALVIFTRQRSPMGINPRMCRAMRRRLEREARKAS